MCHFVTKNNKKIRTKRQIKSRERRRERRLKQNNIKTSLTTAVLVNPLVVKSTKSIPKKSPKAGITHCIDNEITYVVQSLHILLVDALDF